MTVVWDIETLLNCFTCVCYEIETKKLRRFVIHGSRNDFEIFCDYLDSVDEMVGFNSWDFDYPVIHPFYEDRNKYMKWGGERLAKALYKRAQKVLDWRDPSSKVKKEWITPLIQQLDLFRVHHFNNRARSTSLKWLQVCMMYENVQEMPIMHDQIVTDDMIPTILSYNTNDVMSTYRFFELSKDEIAFRRNLTEIYQRNMMNYADTKIGEVIFLRELSIKMGIPEKVLREGRTPRPMIYVEDVILPSVRFETKVFSDVLEKYRAMVLTSTKGENTSVVFDGVTYDFGFGGLHALRGPGIYHNLEDADVSSYYPNLAIGNRLYPKHLGEDFCDVYEFIYQERKKFKKGSPENAAYKLALNGTFGNSNAPWSPFYDPQFTMAITLNGQFLLAMLCERLTLAGAVRIVMANTDGITYEILNERTLRKICKDWEEEFRLELEFVKYKKFAIANVNNYLGVDESEKVKEKGCFETKKLLHKDQSMMIVPKAVREYFVNGKPISQTVQECTDLKDFIIGHRAKTGNLEFRKVDGSELHCERLPKNIRYYISRSGGSVLKMLKKKEKVSPVNLHKGRVVTMFNKWVTKPFEEYAVYKPYYVTEAQKIIDSVESIQVELFA
jgi:hypothetical protein